MTSLDRREAAAAMTGLSETDLIAGHFAPWAGEGAFGLSDDAAVLRPRPDHDIVVTVDAIVESVHFLPGDPPASVAMKALGVNVSDVIAKGAKPKGFLLTLVRPQAIDDDWLAAFAMGLRTASKAFACPLLGGDTTSTKGPLTISVTAFGEVPAGAMVRREGAKVGDVIAVTGTIGDAAIGLKLRMGTAPPALSALDRDRAGELVDRYLHPHPHLAAFALVRDYASASMDVSDGLVGDLGKLLKTSRCGGQLFLADVPLSRAAREAIRLAPDLLDVAVTGGDDYQALFTVAPERWSALAKAAALAQVPLARIGYVTDRSDLQVRDAEGSAVTFARGSFSHF